MSPSLSDIARAANVSKSTVSKVLNGYRDISPATRELVESALVTLGVPIPDRPRSSTALLVLPTLDRPALLAAADQISARRGLGLQLCTVSTIENHPLFEAHSSRPDRRFQGVIAVDVDLSAPVTSAFTSRELDVISIVDRSRSATVDVRIDHQRAINAALMYLADRGHRSVSIDGGRTVDPADVRVETLMRTATELGFELTDRTAADAAIALSDAAVAGWLRPPAPRRAKTAAREVIGFDTTVPGVATISSPYAEALAAALGRFHGPGSTERSDVGVVTKASRFRAPKGG